MATAEAIELGDPGDPATPFGPLASILPFADEDQAVELATGTRFGLSAMVFTDD